MVAFIARSMQKSRRREGKKKKIKDQKRETGHPFVTRITPRRNGSQDESKTTI
jgi:hypothetical protein